MADSDNNKSVWSSPPVIGAMITGAVTIAVTVITLLFQAQNSQPRVIVTSTPEATRVAQATFTPSHTPTNTLTPTNTPSDNDATIPVDTATATATPEPVTVSDTTPNVTLLYDDAAFTIHNISGNTLDLTRLSFASDTRTWDATGWGPSLANSLPSDDCLRMRDAMSGQRQPPAVCANLYGFLTVGESALFWREGNSFEVRYDGEMLTTCDSTADQCDLAIPQ